VLVVLEHAHARRRLIHQVDGLVRQEAIRDVTRGEFRSSLQCLVRDAQIVMLLISAANPLEDQDGVLNAGLVDVDGLETALKCRVGLDMLAVLVQSCRSDALQFAAGQRRLQDVRRVYRTARRPGSHQHV